MVIIVICSNLAIELGPHPVVSQRLSTKTMGESPQAIRSAAESGSQR
jgi:hypothetical protein